MPNGDLMVISWDKIVISWDKMVIKWVLCGCTPPMVVING